MEIKESNKEGHEASLHLDMNWEMVWNDEFDGSEMYRANGERTCARLLSIKSKTSQFRTASKGVSALRSIWSADQCKADGKHCLEG